MSLANNHCLIINGRQSLDLAEALFNHLNHRISAELLHLSDNHSPENLRGTLFGFDVQVIEEKLSKANLIIYLPRIPLWTEKLNHLASQDLPVLSNLLNASIFLGSKHFIFFSDIEAMGSSEKTVIINEKSLWSGQTKANDVQKFWYLCEQECNRAKEEGLNVNTIAIASMAASPTLKRIAYYSSPVAYILKAIDLLASGVQCTDKLCLIERTETPSEATAGSSKSLFSRFLFRGKEVAINRLDFDDSASRLFLSSSIH